MAAGRRLGGAHRRRSRTRDVADGFRGLGDPAAILAFLEGAARDTLAMEPSAQRVRLAVAIVTPALHLVEIRETGEVAAHLVALETRLERLEQAPERGAPGDADARSQGAER